MRITRIAGSGLLSFAGGASGPPFSIDIAQTTVVIGPNGSGKSNVVGLVQLVIAALAAESRGAGPTRVSQNRGSTALDEAGVRLRHHGFPEGEIAEARLGLELTTPAECQFVATFLRAALVSQLTTNNPNGKPEDCWSLAEQIPDRAFEPFFRGELVAVHPGITGTYWRVRFELSEPVDGLQLVWDLWTNSGELARADATEQRPLPDIWTQLGLQSPMGQRTGDPPEKLPDMRSFSFAALANDPAESWPTVVGLPGLRPEQQAPAVRRFLAMADIVAPSGVNTSIGAAYVWDRLLRDGIRIVDVDAPLGLRGEAGLFARSWRYSPEELAEAAGPSARKLPLRLWQLHNGGPEGVAALHAVKDYFRAIAPGRELCVGGRLVSEEGAPTSTSLQLMVSDAHPGGIGRFSQPSPVVAVPTASGAPDPGRRLLLEIDLSVRTGSGRTEPLLAAGSGVTQALVIAEALGTSTGRLTILDEPAVNLHPEWQRLVREQIDRLATTNDDPSQTAQFVLITHSASLAAPTRATGTTSPLPTRLVLVDGATRAIRPPEERNATKWPVDLQLSPEPWTLLFANGVLLTEGATEVGALPVWFDKISREQGSIVWNARNLAIFSVGGHAAFGSWARFLCHYSVRFALCCDGQVLDPYVAIKEDNRVTGFVPNKTWIFDQIAQAKSDQLGAEIVALRPAEGRWEQHPGNPEFEDVRSAAAQLGIFTVATWFQKTADTPAPSNAASSWESMDDLIDHEPALSAAKKAMAGRSPSRSNVRIGAYVATNCGPPPTVRQLYEDVVTWFD